MPRWDPADHPRDHDGRFTDGWASKLSSRIAPRGETADALENTLEGHGRVSPDGPYFKLVKIVVPERGQGTGTRLMRQLTARADELGVTLTLTPETDFGASSVARLTRFYRRFGFRPNRGRTRDFDTQALMIRPPGGR